MDSLNFDLMAKETIELTKNFSLTDTQSRFDFLDDFTFEEPKENSFDEQIEDEEVFPSAPGLFYYIQKGTSTFCLRGIATSDLSDVEDDWLRGESSLLKKLRVANDESPSEIFYFETPSLERAQILEDNFVNRRFPIEEEMLCNLSDPGFSWWMDEGEDHIQVYFRSHGINRSEDLTRLGPLGDRVIAGHKLAQLESLLRAHFPITEFSVSDKFFSILTSQPNHPGFQAFKSFFTSGNNCFKDIDFDSIDRGKTLKFYFEELALLREFWLVLESDFVN